MNRAALLRRLDDLERRLRAPRPTQAVLDRATDEELDALEDEIDVGRGDVLWAALVAACWSEGRRS